MTSVNLPMPTRHAKWLAPISSITLKCSTIESVGTAILAVSAPRSSSKPHFEARRCPPSLGHSSRVWHVYPCRTARHTLDFVDAVIEGIGFLIQLLLADRGSEFFSTTVQERLMAYGNGFRPIRPSAPHLNGKVEQSQNSDEIEFGRGRRSWRASPIPLVRRGAPWLDKSIMAPDDRHLVHVR